jgi:hypothetical protein
VDEVGGGYSEGADHLKTLFGHHSSKAVRHRASHFFLEHLTTILRIILELERFHPHVERARAHLQQRNTSTARKLNRNDRHRNCYSVLILTVSCFLLIEIGGYWPIDDWASCGAEHGCVGSATRGSPEAGVQ